MGKNITRSAAAFGLATVGLLVAGPLASADTITEKDGDVLSNNAVVVEDIDAAGLVNAADNNVQVPVQACNNYLPINAVGGQLNDVAGSLSILDEGINGAAAGTAGGEMESCTQGAALHDGE